MGYLVNLEMRHWSWRKVLVSPLFSGLSLFMHLLCMFEMVLESVAFASPSHTDTYTNIWTFLVCNLSLKSSDCSISDCKEVLCSNEILWNYPRGEWNNRTALQIWKMQGKKKYFLLGFFCFLQIFSRTSKMLNIYCLHSVNNYSVVLVNSTAVLGVTKLCANKYLFLFCALTQADAVNRVKNNQILQLRLLFICLFPKGWGHLDLSCTFCSISRINASILEVSDSKIHLSSQGERHVLPAARKGNALRAMHAGCYPCSYCSSLCDPLYWSSGFLWQAFSYK